MKIEVTNLEPQPAIALKKTAVHMDHIADVVTQGFSELEEYVAAQGREIVSAPYLAYMNCSEDFSQFDIELGMPVSEAVSTDGDFYMSQSCEGKAIVTTHKGAYKDIDAAYNALMDYAKENELEMTGVYYDYYIDDPAVTPEEELLTQVVFPIKE